MVMPHSSHLPSAMCHVECVVQHPARGCRPALQPFEFRSSSQGLALRPTVKATDTLRPAISVRMSSGDAAFDLADAGLTAVIAWLSVRLFTARRMRDCDSLDDPR